MFVNIKTKYESVIATQKAFNYNDLKAMDCVFRLKYDKVNDSSKKETV